MSQYKLTYKGKSIDLPKITLSVQEKIDGLVDGSTSKSSREFATSMYEFLTDDMKLSTDLLNELLGGEDLETIDIRELEILTIEIVKKYHENRSNIKVENISRDLEELIKKNPKACELLKNLATVKQF